MTDTINRYALTEVRTRHNLGVGAEVLSVAGHKGDISLWARVPLVHDVDEWRTFVIVGTGTRVPDGDLKFIGTAILNEYVFHVFEEV